MLVLCSNRDANRLRRAEAGEGADDHALLEQCFEEELRVFAELDEDEVSDRRSGELVTGVAQDAFELGTPVRVRRAPPAELVRRVEARKRSFLRRRRQVERTTRLPQGGDELGGTYAVADSKTCEAVDLRERTSDQHTLPRLEVLLHRIGIVGVIDVLEVGLVDDGQD